MVTLSLAGLFLEPGSYDWGSVRSGDSKLTETIANGRRAAEEDYVGNLIVYQKRRHWDEQIRVTFMPIPNPKSIAYVWKIRMSMFMEEGDKLPEISRA